MNPLMSMIGNMGGGNNPMGAMMQAMILDADFRDERQAIMQQIRKLADS